MVNYRKGQEVTHNSQKSEPELLGDHENVDGDEILEALADSRRKSRLRLGDALAAVTKALGIEPCGACRERQARLNRLL
jgi:hypothetical protein